MRIQKRPGESSSPASDGNDGQIDALLRDEPARVGADAGAQLAEGVGRELVTEDRLGRPRREGGLDHQLAEARLDVRERARVAAPVRRDRRQGEVLAQQAATDRGQERQERLGLRDAGSRGG